MRTKVLVCAALVLLAAGGARLAGAHSSGVNSLHEIRNILPENNPASGAFDLGTTVKVKLTKWFQDRPAWQNRVQDMLDEFDATNGDNIHFNILSGYLADNGADWDGEGSYGCGTHFSNFHAGLESATGQNINVVIAADPLVYNFTGLGGTIGPCNTEGDSQVDFSLLVLNLDEVAEFQWIATQDGNTSKWDVQGVVTHEFFHALGVGDPSIGEHWEPPTAYLYLCDGSGIDELIMCGNYNQWDSWLARDIDEHNDLMEWRDAY